LNNGGDIEDISCRVIGKTEDHSIQDLLQDLISANFHKIERERIGHVHFYHHFSRSSILVFLFAFCELGDLAFPNGRAVDSLRSGTLSTAHVWLLFSQIPVLLSHFLDPFIEHSLSHLFHSHSLLTRAMSDS
jgi:hypothetical protein